MTEIVSYLNVYPTDDVDSFVYIVSQMDIEYMTVKYSKSSGNTDNG